MAISEKTFFITCNLSRNRNKFTAADFEALAGAIDRARARQHFFVTGYIFMPDHWHALLHVPRDGSLPQTMNSIKVAAARRINMLHNARGPLWQPRYFDRVMRTINEYHETLEYLHLNPVRRGLVRSPGEWLWSSFHSYGGPSPERLVMDRLRIPTDENAYL